MIPSTNWLEQVKYITKQMIDRQTYALEGVVSSVNPDSTPYTVKVVLYPYEIETGWLRVGTPYAGDNYGLILPAPEEGTPVKVIFHMGDIQNGTVITSLFNDNLTFPNVTYGTAGIIHKSGSSIFINQDNSIKISHPSGSFISIGTDGTVTIKGKNTTASW